MEKISLGSKRYEEVDQFNLREWALRSNITRDNTKSRRFSASNITSFREETRSFRSNPTFSSTTSSPSGYPFGDEIDPSTYSFTTALKALQAKAGYGWECLSPDIGFALNSKWSEAEKYICNPLSGEFPVECLSAKTLSGRIMSLPTTLSRTLAISSSHAKPLPNKEEDVHEFLIQEKNVKLRSTRDVGTQSTPPDLSSSSSPSPSSTPSIRERSLKLCDYEDGESSSGTKSKSYQESEENETREIDGRMKQVEEEEEDKGGMCKCKQGSDGGGGGCLSWIVWLRKRQRGKHKPRRWRN